MPKLSDVFQRFQISIYSHSIDECVDICMMEMSNDEDGLQAFYRYAEKRMHREHPEWFKESVNTNVSAADIVNEIQREYGSFTLDEIKADLASDGDADIDDEAGWILQKALIEIANQCEATDEFWIKVQQELELLF